MKRQRSGSVVATTNTTHRQHHHSIKTPTVQQEEPSVVEVVSCAAAFPISQSKRIKYNHHQNDDDDNDDNNNNNDDSKQTSARGSHKKSSSTKLLLDWNETVREVQKFGAQGWGAATLLRSQGARTNNDNNTVANKNHHVANTILERKKFRAHENEQYELLTGRKKKHHAVPLPILRGIQKKAVAREQRVIQEAKESGIVLPRSSSTSTGTATTPRSSQQQKEQRNKQQNYKRNQAHGPAPSIGFMKQGMYQVPQRGHDNRNGGGGGNDRRRKNK